MTGNQKQVPEESKENAHEQNSSFFTRSKRNFPSSRLSSDSEEEPVETAEPGKKVKSSHVIFGSKAAGSEDKTLQENTIQLPMLRVQPSLGGGKEIRFPITPRATLLELKDFILFSLNIPHYQQVLTFQSAVHEKRVNLSNLPETMLLSEVPGLIDELTGYSAPVSLSFKMSSGLDLTPYNNDLFDSDNEDFSASFSTYEFDSTSSGPGAELAASLAALIPAPPGTKENSRFLVRSISKASASNSNMPTLWEVYFPESNVKMIVSALINIQKREDSFIEARDAKNGPIESKTVQEPQDQRFQLVQSKVPKIVITSPEEEEEEKIVMEQMDSLKLASPVSNSAPEPKPYCAQCKMRCRPALRFICKCGLTFCQTHRYPDKHVCTFDHRAAGLASIQASNPKVVRDKVENI